MTENERNESSERARKIQLMQDFFYYVLCEDPIDGTSFDMDIMRVLASLREKYRAPKGKDPCKNEVVLILNGKVSAATIREESHDLLVAALKGFTVAYDVTHAEALVRLANLGSKKAPLFPPGKAR